MTFQFIEGDVIARPGNLREPYGTVVFTGKSGWGTGGYLVHVFVVPPAGTKLPTNTVFVKSLDGYVALPSAVRDTAGNVKNTKEAQAALDRVTGGRASAITRATDRHLTRAGFDGGRDWLPRDFRQEPALGAGKEQVVVEKPRLFELGDGDQWG